MSEYPERANFRIPGTGGPVSGAPTAVPAGASFVASYRARLRTAGNLTLAWLVAIWGVFLLNLFSGGYLNSFGIRPLDTAFLPAIASAPFLHSGFAHIMGNTTVGSVAAFLIGLSGKRTFLGVTFICIIVAGTGTWLLGGAGTNHIGASGVVYGWVSYLVVRGFYNRSPGQIIVGTVMLFAFSGMIHGFWPQAGLSWQGHLFGAIGGVIAGATIGSMPRRSGGGS
ncbi:rhomboid family intramembrane serine protease [Corynebacterium sp. CCM 9204]|uniref:rhomboid family intramembrane serine protease n=1 Tax=Corynebacterium sp. CCM 9204 TaxID=3057616 RepID=UPI003523AAD1